MKHSNPDGPKRTSNSYNKDVIDATERGVTINGVKGKCNLSHLKHYNPVSSTCIDYMHSILEGVVKNFFKFWFSSEYRISENFSLRKFIHIKDHKLLLIKPPSFVPNAPRSLGTWKQWRAHEFLAFILYYAIPVFNNIMSPEYHRNILKLVIFIEILLSKAVNINHLKISQKLIVEFINELNSLYPECIMLSGVHELLHFVECTLDFGPLNMTNLFTYEELNRIIVRSIKGKDLIGEEFIKLFSTAQRLSKIEPTTEVVKEFLKKTPILRTSNRKNHEKSSIKIKFLSTQYLSKDLKYLNVFNEFTKKKLDEIYCIDRLQYKSHVYETLNEKKKFCDSCFVSSSGVFGVIETFLFDNVNVYVVGRKVINIFNYNWENNTLNSNLQICHITDELFLTKLEEICKCVLIFISDTECYISKFSMSHLFT